MLGLSKQKLRSLFLIGFPPEEVQHICYCRVFLEIILVLCYGKVSLKQILMFVNCRVSLEGLAHLLL